MWGDLPLAVQNKYMRVWYIAQKDREYKKMQEELFVLEARYYAVLEKLSEREEEAIIDFVLTCEDMSRRMLEIACEEMEFRQY